MKILTNTSIPLNNEKQEFQETEKDTFDLLMVNDGDIHDFFAGYIPTHWHNELEFFVLLEGKVRVTTEKECYDLRPEEGCFINTNQIHSFTALVSSSCKYRSFVVSSEVISGSFGNLFDLKYIQPLLNAPISFLKFSNENEKDKFYFEQFSLAFSACLSQDYGYEFEIRQALTNICLFILKQNKPLLKQVSSNIRETRLKELLEWIDKNYLTPITSDMISKKANICTRECQRMFRQYLHCTPVEYIQKKRIYKAAQLLLTTNQSVTEIAVSCGFSSPNYFTKQFKLIVGITPLRYRHTATYASLLTQVLHPESS